MNRALLAVIIFVSVSAFIAIQTWLMSRSLTPGLKAAAEDQIAGRASSDYAPLIGHSRNEKRLYLASWLVQLGAFIMGALLVGREGPMHGVGLGVLVFAVVLGWARIVVRIRVRNARLRLRDKAGVIDAG